MTPTVFLKGRVEYFRRRHGENCRVLADIDGEKMDFAESAFAEVRWYPFDPSPTEVEHAKRLLAAGKTFDRKVFDADDAQRQVTVEIPTVRRWTPVTAAA